MVSTRAHVVVQRTISDVSALAPFGVSTIRIGSPSDTMVTSTACGGGIAGERPIERASRDVSDVRAMRLCIE